MVDVCGGCADGAEAHHHAGLAMAAAGGGEGRVRERDEMPGPMGNGGVLGILIPHDLICLFLLWPSSFLLSSQEDPPLLLVCSPTLLLSFTLKP